MAVLRDDDLPRTVYETSKVNVDNAKIAVMKYIHYPLADGHGRAGIFLFEVLGKKRFYLHKLVPRSEFYRHTLIGETIRRKPGIQL